MRRPRLTVYFRLMAFSLTLLIRNRRIGSLRSLSWALSQSQPSSRGRYRIAVVGGGASGIFAAISAAEAAQQESVDASIRVLEAGSKTLTKVKVSGGGRCNVLHDTSKPVDLLLQGYPRGKKELNGLLHKQFPPKQAQEWFETNGVTLKTESDGRMFPTTDSSQTIIDTLLTAVERTKIVQIQTRTKVTDVVRIDPSDGNGWTTFSISYETKTKESKSTQRDEIFDAVIMATGSTPYGYRLIQSLDHKLVPTVPSLFTLSTAHDVKEDGVLYGLSGVSVPYARVSFRIPDPVTDDPKTDASPNKKKRKKPKYISQEGPLLITHRGLSGPAALRLSAFGARDLALCKYQGDLQVHWAPMLPDNTIDGVFEKLWACTQSNPKKTVSTVCPLLLPTFVGNEDDPTPTTAIPKRLWGALVRSTGMAMDLTWGQAPKKLVRKLATQVCACPLIMTSKGTFKEEFVTAGGVKLNEINMKTMQSKKCPGLFFCGELIDVDGVTGGYNFMNCWYVSKVL